MCLPNLRDVISIDRLTLGFDLETTHTNKDIARIVELGIEIMKPGEPTKEYRTYVNPGISIPPSATAIHHITDEMVKDAPTFKQLAPNLLKGFTGADLAGFNVRFDVGIIAAEFTRAGYTWDYNDARIIDGFRLWQIAEPRSLDDAWVHWVDELERATVTGDSHSALYDVKRSTRVIACQVADSDKLRGKTMQELHDMCWPGWYDSEGKLKWHDGALCLSFGEHREKPLSEVPEGYLRWMLKKNFSEKVRGVIRDALNGVYHTPPEALTNDADPDDE